MNEIERERRDEDAEADAPDPAGAYDSAPGRTGKHPEGDTPADETVPPGE